MWGRRSSHGLPCPREKAWRPAATRPPGTKHHRCQKGRSFLAVAPWSRRTPVRQLPEEKIKETRGSLVQEVFLETLFWSPHCVIFWHELCWFPIAVGLSGGAVSGAVPSRYWLLSHSPKALLFQCSLAQLRPCLHLCFIFPFPLLAASPHAYSWNQTAAPCIFLHSFFFYMSAPSKGCCTWIDFLVYWEARTLYLEHWYSSENQVVMRSTACKRGSWLPLVNK